MVIHLDRNTVNVECAVDVMEPIPFFLDSGSYIQHVRGRIIATSIQTFIKGGVTMLDVLPPRVLQYLQLMLPSQVPRNIGGCSVQLDAQAMVWHGVTVTRMVTVMETSNPDVWVVPVWDGEQPMLYITFRLMSYVNSGLDTAAQWNQCLPNLSDLLRHNWTSMADVFCAESSCVHGMLRVPVLSKAMTDELQR